MFRHPNYYKKLRASRREKAISPDDASTDDQGRTPRVTPTGITMISCKDPKPQATSSKEPQATSKRQAG